MWRFGNERCPETSPEIRMTIDVVRQSHRHVATVPRIHLRSGRTNRCQRCITDATPAISQLQKSYNVLPTSYYVPRLLVLQRQPPRRTPLISEEPTMSSCKPIADS